MPYPNGYVLTLGIKIFALEQKNSRRYAIVPIWVWQDIFFSCNFATSLKSDSMGDIFLLK